MREEVSGAPQGLPRDRGSRLLSPNIIFLYPPTITRPALGQQLVSSPEPIPVNRDHCLTYDKNLSLSKYLGAEMRFCGQECPA